jgi:hypothetical protein
VQLSLDIMLTVGAFVLLDTGAASVVAICEARRTRPGSVSTAEVRDGSPRNLRAPTIRRAWCRMGQPAEAAPGRRAGSPLDGARQRTRRSEQRVEPVSEAISERVSDVGSRSALVVPLTSGNLALGDPAEGRGAPQWQNRGWETRRAP